MHKERACLLCVAKVGAVPLILPEGKTPLNAYPGDIWWVPKAG